MEEENKKMSYYIKECNKETMSMNICTFKQTLFLAILLDTCSSGALNVGFTSDKK